ncbi:O-6-methylguanine DNA methyltransferase [Longilinea arvoryzae]|uniref:methylated-DNA--[protein]-cysteine S-methyltransferase n=1 Tax=Longilinea arvoryzae TaxID=360412 RepID=A0A0S7BIC5_9CHLR|nr:methylated-DNA--[protein]-cysteine S-methyltransferase [Longilinea arvoryzae]GAP13922.1 O-6-methylguanine DNA methyltransferase [Longilinea arvoryzae]
MRMDFSTLAPLWADQLPSSPLGPLTVVVSEVGLVRLDFAALPAAIGELRPWLAPAAQIAPHHLAEALEQLDDYLGGRRREFDLTIDWRAMPEFSARALQAAAAIPCGQVLTYGELAHRLGLVNGARAVGQAMASNPIPIVLPCHRVVGADRRLHGYSGLYGIETKAWLLKLEGSTFQSQLF